MLCLPSVSFALANSIEVRWLSGPPVESNSIVYEMSKYKSYFNINTEMDIDDSLTKENFNLSDDSINKKLIKKYYSRRVVTNDFYDIISDNCHPYYLDIKLRNLNQYNDFEVVLNKFFKKCDNGLVQSSDNKFAELIRLSLRDYESGDSSMVKAFELRLKNNESVRGFLALKSVEKRPIVIVKCGIFCDGGSSFTNDSLTSAIFDSGPFHLLMLSNHTGAVNISNNKRVSMGGFVEGQEIVEIANWVKNYSSFKDLVSEIHVLGISLGGNAALFSGIYNDNLEEKLISSVIGYCPVVNMKNSIKDASSKGIMSAYVRLKIRRLVKDNVDSIDYLRDIFDFNFIKYRKLLPEALALSTIEYINSLDNRKFLKPFSGIKLESIEDYHYYNDFKQHLGSLNTPTFVWASKNDPVVRYNRNTGLINNFDIKRNNNIQVVGVNKGSHCAMQESYGAYTISKVLTNFFMSYSPSIRHTTIKKNIKINFEQPKILDGESYVSARFLSFPRIDKLLIEYKILKNNKSTRSRNKNQNFRYATISLLRKDLPFSIPITNNKTDARIQTRWLNANVHLKVKNKLFNFTKKIPDNIEWTSYSY